MTSYHVHFLFLQGMPCSLFKRVGDALRLKGAQVSRVNFCPGDWLFWQGNGAISYRGKQRAWPDFIERFFRERQVTDLVLLGEQRDYHKEAVAIAHDLGIRVWVTDFGYFRPDWITLEQNGMGGNSCFPRHPAEIIDRAIALPNPDFRPMFKDSAFGMGIRDIAYNYANLFFAGLYPNYRRSDRRPPTLIYTATTAIFWLRTRLRKKKDAKRVADLVSNDVPFYVFPLQLDHDFQILAYSNFKGMEPAIASVVASFAANAPLNSLLVVKVHPWDAGLKDWSQISARLAEQHGVATRVLYLGGGDLDLLSAHAQGMVTINSTSGLKAMMLGCSVKVLGQAIFDVAGLSYQGSIDTFWQECIRPDPHCLAAFIKLLANDFQIRGVFFREPGLSVAVEQMSHRLWRGTVEPWTEYSTVPSAKPLVARS